MTLEEEVDEFYTALGQAISQWQHVEDQIYQIYAACLASENDPATAAAYHTVVNFQTRLQMTDAALRHTFRKGKIAAEWPKKRDMVRKKSRIRNNLAHFEVVQMESKRPGQRVKLQATISSPDNWVRIDKGQGVYTNKNINNFAEQCAELVIDLVKFKSSIPWQRPSREK